MLKFNGRYSLLAALLTVGALTARADLITNGSFETGDFTGWTVANQASGSGSWFIQIGTTSPTNPFSVPAPPEGTHAAMTDQSNPGSHSLLQSFTVPSGASSVTISFEWFVDDHASGFFTPNSLDYNLSPNEQARVDILTSGAGAFDLGAAVVANLFQTNVGDPLVSGYNVFSTTLNGVLTPGATYQLRFAEVDNQSYFQFGVDSVAVDTPEPGSLALAGFGLIGVAFFRLRRTRQA